METTMILNGYVGHNIELKYTKTGVPTVTFRVGTTPRIRTDDGWIDGTTTWMTVVCYRALAEHVAHCVYRGDPVIVHGKVRTQSWDDAQGVPHEKMVLEAGLVGHDLSRGVAAFTRNQTRTGPVAEEIPEPPGLAEEDECLAEEDFDQEGIVTSDLA